METAAAIVTFAEWWIYIGLAVAALFLVFGLDRLDESARGAFTFRVLIIPGLVLLWPLVICRWCILEFGGGNPFKRHHPPRATHGWVWSVLAAAIPAIFLLAMILGFDAPGDFAPVKLSEVAQ